MNREGLAFKASLLVEYYTVKTQKNTIGCIQTRKVQQSFIYHYLFSRILYCEDKSFVVYSCQIDTNNKSPAILYLPSFVWQNLTS
jgi:hypothetical protein